MEKAIDLHSPCFRLLLSGKAWHQPDAAAAGRQMDRKRPIILSDCRVGFHSPQWHVRHPRCAWEPVTSDTFTVLAQARPSVLYASFNVAPR